eukprot:4741209-Alexandrium_andersonii.AAC.1
MVVSPAAAASAPRAAHPKWALLGDGSWPHATSTRAPATTPGPYPRTGGEEEAAAAPASLPRRRRRRPSRTCRRRRRGYPDTHTRTTPAASEATTSTRAKAECAT